MNTKDEPLFDDPDDPLQAQLDEVGVLREIMEKVSEISDPGHIQSLILHLETLCPIPRPEDYVLGEEISFAYVMSKTVLADVMRMPSKATERAAAIRSVQASLKAIIDMQKAIYNIEQYRMLEMAIMRTFEGRSDAQELLQDFKQHYKILSRPKEDENSTLNQAR